jgi:ATP-dependent RNA helicase DeaD
MCDDIKQLAIKHMVNHKEILVSKDDLTVDITRQFYIMTTKDSKRDELVRVFEDGHPKTIVFCHTKRRVDYLTRKLEREFSVGEIHGGMAQNKRENVIKQFSNGDIDLMIATDVAARGLDIFDVGCVINFDMPDGPETYIHRIGRTGRAGAAGMAVTFVMAEEFNDLKVIEKKIGKPIVEMPPTSTSYSEGPQEPEKKTGRKSASAPRTDNRRVDAKKTDSKEDSRKTEPRTAKKKAPVANVQEDDVSVTKTKRGTVIKKAKAEDDSQVEKGDTVRLEIGFGTKDGIGKNEVCEFITSDSDVKDEDLGTVTMYDKKAHIRMERARAEIAVRDLYGLEYEGRPLSVRIIPKD